MSLALDSRRALLLESKQFGEVMAEEAEPLTTIVPENPELSSE